MKSFLLISSILFAAVCQPGDVSGQAKIKFPISISSKSLGYGPMFAAVKLGFMEREGLEGQVVVVRGADKSLSALMGGSVFVSASGTDAHIAAVERGVELSLIGGTINGLSQVIMAPKQYKTLNDLRGATIGATSATAGLGVALRRYMKAKGFEFGRDYHILATGSAGPTLAALNAGQVQAAALGVPLNFVAADQGFTMIGRIIDVVPSYQFAGFSVSRAAVEKNRPLLVRFMKAMIGVHRWFYDNKEAAVEFLAKQIDLKPDYARRGWEYYIEHMIWPNDASVNLEGLTTSLQIYWESSQSKGPLPNAAKYVDPSILKEAMKELTPR
ncbi:MAG: ABC transporter substrate-binding protein [Deltaproteobacteria bacterium]|nr:ABC transporter substrate-binding protein [Deltaproteobacteria bacterium]